MIAVKMAFKNTQGIDDAAPFRKLLKPVYVTVSFLVAFRYIWNRMPRCAICHRPIQLGQKLQWLGRTGRQVIYRIVVHVECLKVLENQNRVIELRSAYELYYDEHSEPARKENHSVIG